MDAGFQGARFDATNLPSGIYTARITFGGLRREIKMILNGRVDVACDEHVGVFF